MALKNFRGSRIDIKHFKTTTQLLSLEDMFRKRTSVSIVSSRIFTNKDILEMTMDTEVSETYLPNSDVASLF